MQMQMNAHLSQRQEMKLAPRMIQAMKILQLPAMALEEQIALELEKNPLLERVDPAAPPDEEETPAVEEKEPNPDGPLVIDENHAERDFNRLEEINRDWEDHFNEDHRPSHAAIEEAGDRKHDAMQNMPSRPPSLHDHLLEQITFLDVEPEEYELLRYVISHIADNGLLGNFQVNEIGDAKKKHPDTIWVPITLEELVANFPGQVTMEDMEGALEQVQRLDPPGVGARNIEECLLLQVTPDTPRADLLRQLIRDHLDDIKANRLPAIEKKTGAPLEEIQAAIEQLRHLDTHPGSRFASKETQYVVPDVIVTLNDDGEYDVRIADEWLPEVRISKRYREMVKQKNLDEKTKGFLKKNLQPAEWLIDAIQQRRNTLEKVTRAIIRHQRAFLDKGPDFIEPLKMEEIAKQVGVHVTTVSRAVDDKWVETPRGNFPLKRFFVGGTKNEQTGEMVAWETIKNKLLEMIAAEDKANPLSDEEIVDLFEKAGLTVARRTVTKYRKMLDIPSSRQRKEWTHK